MFKAFTVDYTDIPPDVNRTAFETDGIEEYSEDYLVVQVDGKTIFCKPESGLSKGTCMIMDLMELAYYLGVVAGIKHEQGYNGGKIEGAEGGDALCPYCGADIWWTVLEHWNGKHDQMFKIICSGCDNNVVVNGGRDDLMFVISKYEE